MYLKEVRVLRKVKSGRCFPQWPLPAVFHLPAAVKRSLLWSKMALPFDSSRGPAAFPTCLLLMSWLPAGPPPRPRTAHPWTQTEPLKSNPCICNSMLPYLPGSLVVLFKAAIWYKDRRIASSPLTKGSYSQMSLKNLQGWRDSTTSLDSLWQCSTAPMKKSTLMPILNLSSTT